MFSYASIGNCLSGFYTTYFFHKFPHTFLTLVIADKLGIFARWKVDFLGGPGDNSPEFHLI